MRVCTSLAMLVAFAACGGSDPGTTADASVDGAGPSVRTVTCPPGQMPTVTTTDNTDHAVYSPMSTTISVRGIVKFVMPTLHNVAPNPLRSTDSGLRVDFGATGCLEFDKAGTFNFMCTAHSFQGTIVVQ
jgi:plastocyanin